MGYRDELHAARARVESLESELVTARSRIAHLEAELAEARRPRSPSIDEILGPIPGAETTGRAGATKPAATGTGGRTREPGSGDRGSVGGDSPRLPGGIHYHPPGTYFPFIGLWLKAVEAVGARMPIVERPSSPAVWRWFLHYCVTIPFTYGLRIPLYFPTCFFGLILTLAICVVGSILCLPFLVLSRFSFSPGRPQPGTGWWAGTPTIGAAATFLWLVMSIPLAMSVVGMPLMYVTASLVKGERLGDGGDYPSY